MFPRTLSALLLEREPAPFRAQVLARPKSDWIVVDEVQRVPRLLDEVHFLMEEQGYRRFALTGSSARKLRRGAANLLAGRAVLRTLFPLTAAELDFSVPAAQRLRFGSMPLSITAADDPAREDYLRTFVTTYLAEEIRAEGLVRNLGSFSRFLDVAALAAGQTTNVSAISRNAGVSRETARGGGRVRSAAAGGLRRRAARTPRAARAQGLHALPRLERLTRLLGHAERW
jgi:predicted AAA+ superfamily ATPase